MNIKQVYAVYFSSTGGTRAYVEGIAGRLDKYYQTIDLTNPETRARTYHFSAEDLVLLGAPVYGGRLPQVQGGIFDRLQGDHTPAVWMVSYGNREFDDALLEEQEICSKKGFVGIAAASWIAPHTFSARIAEGRPDAADTARMDEFAEKLRERLKGELPVAPLALPGNHPYKVFAGMPMHPVANEACTECSSCAAVCPTAAIDRNHPKEVDGDRCINCFACVKHCPEHARGIDHPMFLQTVQKLEGMLLNRRKEPEFFFAE